jgi:hypothetical protein
MGYWLFFLGKKYIFKVKVANEVSRDRKISNKFKIWQDLCTRIAKSTQTKSKQIWFTIPYVFLATISAQKAIIESDATTQKLVYICFITFRGGLHYSDIQKNTYEETKIRRC